ncbi:MAG: secondary thiamine-phosphate synthase enzyme YjbQ [Candidatus Parvarchaeota archaeon]|nr:secondary thiamine-phosphate synthase enzyme YjbQ [Candidatus Jingweiarchaeum tengchongense]MCW1298363.1 secondary thiamine-phosphate synthase enzyme YjbQ [Candidatus Jingweiarchaeum tengchongense]MCW1300335.1 secondary thiamine-phosphate synthase enzyme YjbQ [Candidatus Jingweiarchaeum tengchongense]MCW1304868.1 secondary thiamine-phosphate synthase enzyme YjbQ [Candidatus Jingweiarchaeum tengchongense]MCW1305831.1 secondary thiamine-phosphate synthase enzyme YjbQ [Candidatus Jingweiarchaeu
MKIFQHEFNFSTTQKIEIFDLTNDIKKFVSGCGIKEGICLIFAPHNTAALLLQENESGLLEDIKNKIDELFPKDAKYEHNKVDDNAHSHLSSMILNQSLVLPIKDEELILGTWQSILFLEFDGPRELRTVITYAIGEEIH